MYSVPLGPENPHGVCRCLLDIFLQSRKNLSLPRLRDYILDWSQLLAPSVAMDVETLSRNIFLENVPHFNPLSRLDEPSASVPRCINPLSFRCEAAASRRIIVPEQPGPARETL